MRINTQFPVAVHILAVLAYFEKEDITSDDLARSVGTNPVVVRRIVSQLKKAGLVSAQAGVKGISLCRKPKDITLLDIYNAVRSSKDTIFGVHPNPSQSCEVGAYIKSAVSGPFKSAQQALENDLASHTLLDVLNPILEANDVSKKQD